MKGTVPESTKGSRQKPIIKMSDSLLSSIASSITMCRSCYLEPNRIKPHGEEPFNLQITLAHFLKALVWCECIFRTYNILTYVVGKAGICCTRLSVEGRYPSQQSVSFSRILLIRRLHVGYASHYCCSSDLAEGVIRVDFD